MNALLPTSVPGGDATRAAFIRGALCGGALGTVLGASLALALTRPVEGVVRTLRGRLVGEAREPQFELLN